MTTSSGGPSLPMLVAAGATDTGMVRDANEDAYSIDGVAAIVADGMGGHAAGEVASEIAVSTLSERLRDGVNSVELLVAAVVEANAAIFQAAHSRSDQRGMGTTVVALTTLVSSDGPAQLAVANVGDSRIYRMREHHLERISTDHSYVQELVNTGHISEDEARTHPRRNIVTRALGIEPTVKVDTWILTAVRGDRFVLCSDGLVDEVADNEIRQLLIGHDQPDAAATALVAAANRNGGHDNVTVVVIDVAEGEPAEPAEAPPIPATDWMARSLIVADELPDAERRPTLPIEVGPGEPVVETSRNRLGAVLFGSLLAAIIGITAGLVVALREDDAPGPTTTSTSISTTTTSSTTSTSVSPTTTRPSTTVTTTSP